MPASADACGVAPSHNFSLTLERGLRVLSVLADHPDGLSVAELATALGTHRAGIYRLVGPLNDVRLVERRSDGRYRLGVGLIELASHVRPRLLEVAIPILQQMADDLGATAALTLREGDMAVVAAVVEPRHAGIHVAYQVGLRHRLDQAASGLAILAGGPPRPGERAEVAEARICGYARSAGELLEGTTGVGAPLTLDGPADAAVSAVWVAPRDEAAAIERLLAAASEIMARLN